MQKLLLPALLFFSLLLNSQTSSDVAVQLSASVQTNPAQITLNWITTSASSQYQVYRKLKSANVWGTAIATLTGSANQFIDNAVTVGTSYEYMVKRVASGYSGYGYINSGINVPEIEHRGTLVLLVDSFFITSLASEIQRLIKDIEGDGWNVRRHDVDRNGSVYNVKSYLQYDYYLDSSDLKAVFILGHVPVPYSGNINPDGHPDHLGAWPADCYYGDLDGNWTDLFVTSTTVSPSRTQNIPGDNKFDQSTIPSDLELQVGRVDFHNMPAFSLTETQLLKNYLDKDHDYRKKIYSPIKRAVIDDNFGYFSGEAFASSAYKNFGPLVGAINVTAADYFTSMTGNSYQWSYGCGGGTYVSAGGIGTTSNFASSNLQGVFTMLFGSYFGDWDAQDNFLKAPLAQGRMLTSVWSGRPHYQFYHMAQGENIGYDLLLTQNNPNALYYASPTGITGRWVHNALMGDPTLRNDIVAPVANVVATKSGNNCNISWAATTETNIIGYNVYVKNDSLPYYTKLNTAPITGTTYTDNCLLIKGIYSYMVRALKLEVNASGSYYNMSEGIADTAYNSNTKRAIAAFTSSVVGNVVLLINTNTLVPASYQWDFGNGTVGFGNNPTLTYTANGTYTVTLIATSACYNDTSFAIITISEVGLNTHNLFTTLSLAPNPCSGLITIRHGFAEAIKLDVFSTDGRLVYSNEHVVSNTPIDISALSKGLYMAQLKAEGKILNKKLLIN